jgi:hypothetical protein
VVHLAGTCIAARLPLGLELAFLLSKFSMLAFKTDSLVYQSLEVGESVALELIVQWP